MIGGLFVLINEKFIKKSMQRANLQSFLHFCDAFNLVLFYKKGVGGMVELALSGLRAMHLNTL